MRSAAIATVVASCVWLAGAEAPRAQELDDLRETVEAQGEIIQELRDELERVRDEQLAAEDRVRVLEERSERPAAGGGVDADYVDRRIQDFERAPESRLFLSGYGSALFEDDLDDDDEPSTFDVQFNPIFHFRLTDRLHFNAEFEVGLEKEEGATETDIGVEFATIDYLLTDWLTLEAGKFLVPFNVFGPKLHPQWINKLASIPPIYGGHHAEAPGIVPILGDVGFQARGGTTLWDEESKLHYALYVVNGPSFEADFLEEGAGEPLASLGHDDELVEAEGADDHHDEEPAGGGEGDDHHDEEPAGGDEGDDHDHDHDAALSGELLDAELLGLEFDNVPDNNDNKTLGGRLGFLPVHNLELGVSFMTGRTGGTESRFNLLGADLWYFFQGLELRGEFMRLSRDRDGRNPDVWGYYAQAAYRLRYHLRETTGLLGHLGKLEPVVRWSEIEEVDPLERQQLALGLNYWILESVPLKFTWEFNDGAIEDDRLLMQIAYGF